MRHATRDMFQKVSEFLKGEVHGNACPHTTKNTYPEGTFLVLGGRKTECHITSQSHLPLDHHRHRQAVTSVHAAQGRPLYPDAHAWPSCSCLQRRLRTTNFLRTCTRLRHQSLQS